jgi:outer membrane immunogenic protein
MSKRIAFAVMLLLVASGEAFAADLPAAPPPPQAPVAYIPAAPPVYNWGGIYVGINGGWGFGNAKWTVGPLFAFPAGTSHSVSDNGGVVGGTLGANYQTGGLVIGVEGDWDYSGPSATSQARVRPGTIGCLRRAGELVTRPIASCFLPRPAARLAV